MGLPAMENMGWMASMAAAITVSRPGANPPTAEELLAGVPGHQDTANAGVR
ncbi:hypothetical protein [Pseudarthrobacter sp. N5]|uniref:hypothetical protein n=1 Tax=Pseudarthrobacter sp. N5 TaxID=3418416 RepID=UPI003CF1197F